MSEVQLSETFVPSRKAAQPVTTVLELQSLDNSAMVRGYGAGRKNAPDYAERDRGYWHGFLNGLVDGGHSRISAEQERFARDYVSSGALALDVQRWSPALS